MANNAFMSIICTHTAAIIGNTHIGLSAIGNFNLNSRCAGVNSIFHQLFYTGSRSFYDFSCRNFISCRFI